METQYYNNYSPCMGKDMEAKRWGHGGKPVLFIPCQDGRFFDFEGFHMTDTLAPRIESGEITVYSIDVVDRETWSDKDGDSVWRIRRYEQWIHYVTDEVVPFILSERPSDGVLVFGCSLGAAHAANLFYRRPDLFSGLLAISGIYSADYAFAGCPDSLCYDNSPAWFIGGMPREHFYVNLYNSRRSVVVTGLGAWEIPDYTRRLDEALKSKGINTRVEYWGEDVNHDWPWWHKMVLHYMPWLLYEY